MDAAKSRAKTRGVEFSLTRDWIDRNWTGKCALTGIKFSTLSTGRSALSPSIDRENPNKGYTEDNCRFVLWSINAFKGDWTDKEMIRIAKILVSKNI